MMSSNGEPEIESCPCWILDVSCKMTGLENETESHNKPCTLCHTPRPVLVRCQIDETGKWHFVCPGKCWQSVSGGEIDAKGHKDEHPYYRYGGMWKNRHADGPMHAKKPKKNKVQKPTVRSDESEKQGGTDDEETLKIQDQRDS